MGAGKYLVHAICVASFLAVVRPAVRAQDTQGTFPATQLRTSSSRVARKKQEQWFRRGRTTSGQPAAGLRYQAYQQKLRMRALANLSQALQPVSRLATPSSWISLGPAPLASDASGTGEQDYNWVSGRATAVAVDPNDRTGNTVYVGGAFGGLWKSENAGPLCPDPSTVTWNLPASQNPQACLGSANSSAASLLDSQPTLAVGAIAVQPQVSNPDPAKSVVLVGSGEADSSTDSYYGLGILRSADAGNTWLLTTQDTTGAHPFAGVGFSQIAFSTGNPSLVVAAAAGTSQGELDGLQNPVSANLGLYYSNDGGQSWNYAAAMDAAATVQPGSATAVVYNAAADLFFAALRFHGFYSSNDGIHWFRLINQPGNGLSASACPASPALQSCPIYRGQIAVVPKRAGLNGLGEMYVWYVDANDNDQGIWESVDGGSTWTAINDSGIANCGDLLGGCGTENGSYNLTLAAVPDNPAANATSGTDIYAGAVNLYKCVTLATITDCSGAAPNTFLNLTHVYGCPPDFGSIAKVHPSQHAMDFMQVNGGAQVPMYFANDGGIYRTLDGYAGLISGSCSTPNQFDSLNQTLGSMTQFVSLSQHPSDPNTILGGTQGNGSPATSTSQLSSSWISVNSGDGGYTAINPSNPVEWFTANTGVSIQRCALGIDCHSTDFNNDLVVSNSTVGGDGGPLYTPYILDPQNPTEMIVGTCRVWRGTTQGASFVALSQNFDTLSDTSCTGSEVNTVRSLAAGGPIDVNGFSSVLYAGTDGTGPLATPPVGGHVWAMSTAPSGATTWTNVTGAINPNSFPISAVALDASDPTGNTAYVTVMGFHVSHIWQTTNAGQSWADFTGGPASSASTALPDAPVNTVLVDGGILYVGTDVGVFSSPTGTPNWTEVGSVPIANGTPNGYLPEVPVSGLLTFNDGTTKLLRAASYGRGVWQFPLTTTPDFAITVTNPTETVFAGQTATFNGIISAFNGFNNPIALGCSGTAIPSTCIVNPNQVAPAGPTTTFATTAGGTVGDYTFNLQGAAAGLSRSTPLTLHMVDFTLGAPSPAAVPLALGSTSSAVTMQLAFLGSYPATGSISLSCDASTGISCNFFPSTSIPASTGPTVTITLTISAASNAQSGNSTVGIMANSTDAGSKTVNQSLNVTVTSAQDYSLTVNAPTSATAVRQMVSVPGAVTGLNGYSNAVQLTCVSGTTAPPSTCTLTPAAVNTALMAVPFNLTTSSNTAGTYSFGLKGVGSDASATTHVTPVSITFFDFAITADSNSQTVNAGNPGAYALNFTPEGPSTFQQTVNYSCGQLPALTTCSFSPTQIASGSGITQVTLSISTIAAVASGRGPGTSPRILILMTFLPVAGLAWSLGGAAALRRRRRVAVAVVFAIIFLLALLQSACGSGLTGGGSDSNPAQPGTTPGSYTVMITAIEGSGSQAVQPPAVALTLTVQ